MLIVRCFRTLLEGVLANRTELSASEVDPRRTLHAVEYFTMMLFAMYNPIVSTMRGLCRATHYGKVSEQISSAPVSISMFSDAQKVFTPELLDDVFAALLERMPAGKTPRELARIKETLVMVDGTLFHTLKRMGWTEKGDRSRRGAKLNVQLDLRRNTPMAFQLTDARICERKLKCNLRIGHILAESQDGMAMQMYCALIMAMLLQLATGKRPTKRDLELIQFYQMGLVSSEEVELFLRMKKKK